MQFCVEVASSPTDHRDVRFVEQEVFRREKRILLPELRQPEGGAMLQLVARHGAAGTPVGALTAVETTGDDDLHGRYGIVTGGAGRVARYTRLAVLRPFRGLHLPLRLLLEAHRHYVVPNGIGQTWLLFNAARSFSSLVVNLLAFKPSDWIVESEYGACRVLSRNEQGFHAEQGIRRGWAYLSAQGGLAVSSMAATRTAA